MQNYQAPGAALGLGDVPRLSTILKPEDERLQPCYAKLREDAKKKFQYVRTLKP